MILICILGFGAFVPNRLPFVDGYVPATAICCVEGEAQQVSVFVGGGEALDEPAARRRSVVNVRGFGEGPGGMVVGQRALCPILNFVKEPVQFEFVELWEYFPEKQDWRRVEGMAPVKVAIEPVQKPIYSIKDSPVLVKLPERPSLFYAKWTEDGALYGAVVVPYSGTSAIGPDKPGMIRTIVPRGWGGHPEYVPDPAIHCVIKEVKLAPVDAPIFLWAALAFVAIALALYVLLYAVIRLRQNPDIQP